MKPIRENFLVSLATKELRSDRYPDVEWKDSCVVITWLSWDEQTRENDLFVNSWKYQPVFNGGYTSSIFDMGPSFGAPEFISWQSFTNGDTNSIKFQLRAARNLDSLLLNQWFGPGDSMFYYINAAGDSINSILQNQRYIQYRALLETGSIYVSPALNQVSITYVAYDSIAPTFPENLQAIAGHSHVSIYWDANQGIDLMAYRIYRTTISTEYSSQELATVFKQTTVFLDTSAITGVNYYYVITAVDSNLNESTFSDEVMAVPFGITIFVDDDAAADGNGTRENPFVTISNGLNSAIYGDTVLVLPGKYTENIVMKTGVVLKGSGARVTTIQGDKYQETAAFVVAANEAVLQGFTIISPGSANSRPAIVCTDCGPKILNNIIVNYGSESTSGPAIFCAQQKYMLKESPPTQPYIAKNIIRSFRTSLFCMDSAHVVFQNNIILNKGIGFQNGIDITFSNSIIRNNTIILNGAMGTGICISMSNPVISNNIIFNPSENFRGLENLYGQPQISYNDILVGLEAYHNCSPGIGDIQADPMFVNTDRGDFRLAENSPCIDAGAPDSIYNDVDGSRNDMGAFGGPDPINLSMTLQIFLSVGTSSVSGFPGDTVKVSVGVDNAAGIAQAQFAVEFNAELLTLLNVSKTILTKDFSIQSDISQPNKVKVELKNDREIPSGKGSIIDLFFIVNPNAQSEQATPLTLQSVAFVDGSGAPIELKEITHGVFVVNFMGSSEHVVYVDENNNGFEDGSRSYPYNTIYEGITHTDEGDTVVVAGGFYLEKLEINKGIFLKGAGAGVTTVEAGSDTEFEDYTIHLNTQQPCGISGFTITNKSYGFIMSVLLLNAPQAVVTKNKIITDEIWPGLMVDWQDARGGILQENYIHGGGEGLCIKNSPDLLVKNNRFVSKDLGSAALYCENSQVKIIGNKFEVGGIVIGVRIIASSTVSIQNNIFESKTFGGSGIEIKESTGDVINNTIVTNDEGIHSISNASTLVMNNIVVGSQIGSGIYSQGGTVSTYNDIWNQRANYNGISPGEGDISANPLFADSAHSDFHLNPYSPCTDAGKPDAVYNDHDGSRNDMGAFGGPMADTSGFLGRKINVAFANSQIQEGDTLLIPVTATNIQAINDFEMQVKFNESQLSVLTVRQGELTQAFALTENKESPGIIQVNLSSPLDVRQNSGSICELLVQVKNNSDTTTVIRLENLLFRDQIENEYTAASVERCFNISSVKDEKTGSNILPEKITLQQNYPNPFNPVTTICYELPKSSFITIKIYNMLGQEIRILYDGVKHAGAHHAIWDAKDNHGIKMSSGLYFYRFSVE